jgi:uncharacterized protein (DUF2249 family)
MRKKTVRLDVRDDLKRGREPFSRIMQTVSELKETEDLLLIAPFEPTPLFRVLSQHGFSHQARTTAEGDCEVLFTRNPNEPVSSDPASKPAEPAHSPKPPACTGSPVLEVDARGLEPPQPLVKIMEAVAALPQGARLRAFTDRRPMHLYAQLEERGFHGESEEQLDGSFITHIRRR